MENTSGIQYPKSDLELYMDLLKLTDSYKVKK